MWKGWPLATTWGRERQELAGREYGITERVVWFGRRESSLPPFPSVPLLSLPPLYRHWWTSCNQFIWLGVAMCRRLPENFSASILSRVGDYFRCETTFFLSLRLNPGTLLYWRYSFNTAVRKKTSITLFHILYKRYRNNYWTHLFGRSFSHFSLSIR